MSRNKGTLVVLGTFDGVHLGHKKLINEAQRFSNKRKLKLVLITFDPHPQLIVAPERGLELLTTLEERKELLYKLGVKNIKVVRFDRKVQRMRIEDFIKDHLINKLRASHVFVGYDYAFGHQRRGGPQDLKRHGFEVKVVPAVSVKGRHVKSSQIRKEIAQGDFALALKELGHPYQITGKVVKGCGRGRELGFPTANLKIPKHKLLPSYGVYIALANGKKCVVNIGSRPTFGASSVLVEAHIMDFKGGLRGKKLKLYLYKKIREELHFSDVELLKKRIRKDIGIAGRYVI